VSEPQRVFDLRIPADAWMNGGDTADHLTTVLVINGTFHHLEAIRIYEDDDGRQHATAPEFEETLEAMYQIGGDGPFDTVYINSDSYLLLVIPFQ
jgi:hypothetical protein